MPQLTKEEKVEMYAAICALVFVCKMNPRMNGSSVPETYLDPDIPTVVGLLDIDNAKSRAEVVRRTESLLGRLDTDYALGRLFVVNRLRQYQVSGHDPQAKFRDLSQKVYAETSADDVAIATASRIADRIRLAAGN
ncbi:hypothetical protein A3709_19745 [Halioglobus sp. HI00S01]|uniref:hypothetical protein n=1 Tax=Halioglobus sp. HI00S01 TaxID=1822214 RepID=UPI0007C2662A|nr:hypothetical protein [Halioglobus sp. HI00S01]KZX57860.1 hypothetical protein A3709_19745 [Halioglobus sp. HI00S01]